MKKVLAVCCIAWVVAWAAFVLAADAKKLTVRVLDGQPIASRVSVFGSDGKPYAPAGSILRQPEGAIPYFYTDGSFVVTLPPGAARLEFWRGVEYLPVRVDVDLQSDAEIAVRLARWAHLDRARLVLWRFAHPPAYGRPHQSRDRRRPVWPRMPKT